MSRKLLTLNALLVVAAAGLAGFVTWEAMRPAPPLPSGRRAPGAVAAPPPASAAQDVPAAPGAYGIIANRNLFSPTRTDTPATGSAVAGGPAPQVAKPSLYGVVLRDGAPIAYLEDPVTKRVAAYRIGDTVAGGTLKSIDADRVVLTRPEGAIDVRLHDPSKPRPPAPRAPATTAPPAAAGGVRPGVPTVPGLIPPVGPQPPLPRPPQVQVPTQPGAPMPPAFTPGRRPLPPNLLRRFQRNAPGNAPTR